MIKKLYNSSILNSWFSNLVLLFSSVIAIPIVITKLSVEEINVWFLLFTIVTLSQGVLFGFNSTFSRFIAYSYAGVKISEFQNLRHKKESSYEVSLDVDELSRIYHLMKKVYIYLALIYFIVIIIISYISLVKPISHLVNVNDGWVSVGIVIISTTITLMFGYYQVFLEGVNKIALVQRIIAIVNMLGLFFILIVLFLYPTLISIVSVYQTVALTTTGVIFIFGRRECREQNINKHMISFDKELFVIVWESAWKSGITTIIANVVKQISGLLVAQFFSPSVSASFLFTKRIFDIMERFTMTTFQARLPMIARYRARGDFKMLLPFLKQTQYISYSVFLIGYLILITSGEKVLTLISSNVPLGDWSLIILFSLATFTARWAGMTALISSSSNHIVDYINLAVASVIFFSVIYFFYDKYGINVFPLAMFLSYFLAAPTLIFTVYKTIHTTFWNYEKSVFMPMFMLLVVINIFYYMVVG